MASDPTISWQIDGEKVETVTDFIFLGSRITADGDCSHEIKRCLLLGKKITTNLDSLSKIRDITFPTKTHIVKATVFPGFLYRCESWIIKKAECQKIDTSELQCWRRLLGVPWTTSQGTTVYPKGNQSWVFIGRTDAEAESPIIWPPDVKNQLIGNDPDAGKEKRVAEDEMVRQYD